MNLNSVIPGDGIYGINSCKNKRALVGGPTYVTSWLIDWLIDLTVMHDWFILIIDIYIIILYLFTNPDFDKRITARGPGTHSLCSFWFSYVQDWFEYSLIFLLIATSASSY